MKRSSRAGPRLFAAAVLATTLVLAGVQRADAQSVFFSGFTAGCFGTGCTPTTNSDILGGLTYNPGTFAGTATTQTFGSFTLFATNPAIVYNSSFTLLLTFIDPSPSSITVVAAVTGAVAVNMGGISIDFDNTPQSWSDANGTYSVLLNDLLILAGNPTTNEALTGELTGTSTVPEPISMVLLATGLAGLGAACRRRRSVTQAELI